jgi:DNA-binding NarL/FixJ family response regulator
VLRLAAAGRRNREIAAALTVSVRTVEHHLDSIYGKLGVRGRVEATALAVRHGLAAPAEPLEEGGRR